MPHRQFSNREAGFKKMLHFIDQYAKYHSIEGTWLFCLEHTGLYVLPICSFLQQHALNYVLQSALVIQRSLGIRRGKTDRLDAADITRYAFLHQQDLRPSYLPSERLLEIKHLLAFRARLIKSKNSFSVAAKEIAEFSKATSQVLPSSDQLCSQIIAMIKDVEKQILVLIRASPQLRALFDLITSVKGVGLIVGAHLLVYTNGFTAFQCPRQFACYIGIAPFPHRSGGAIKRPDRVSHLANKKLKTIISSGALSARRWDKQLNAYFERKVGEGKNPFLVQNNIKNKFVQRIFAVVKRGTPYCELHQHLA